MMSYIFLFDTICVPVFHLSKNRTGNRFLVPVCTVNRVPVHKTSNMMATSYKDKRQIKFLSTTSPPGVVENGKPHVNVDYNKHMGGVDRFDQLISYYPVGRSGIKWWRYIMWFIVNLSIVNSWIVYSNSERDPRPSKNYDHLQFRADEQLRAGHTSRKHRVGRKSKNADRDIARDVLHLHEVVKVESRKKICRECSQQKRKTPKG